MKIGIASDHRGYELKEKIKKYLKHKNYEIIDYGTNSIEKTDYTTYAFKLGKGIIKKEIELGIAICGTGIGMSIALNKIKNIMCAKVSTKKEAYYSKKHNNANIIAISGNINYLKARNIINTFINTTYEEKNPYQKRINDIKEYEQND